MEGGSLSLVGAEDNCLTYMRVASTFPEVDLALTNLNRILDSLFERKATTKETKKQRGRNENMH